jgi:hypothetical protein
MRCALPLVGVYPRLAKCYDFSMTVLQEIETAIYAVFKNNSPRGSNLAVMYHILARTVITHSRLRNRTIVPRE